MKKLISSKTIALCFGILVVCFAVGFYVIAWTEPTAVPPGGNVAAPINVGLISQVKQGALGVGGVFRAFSNAIVDGNVGIGTTAPATRLHVEGTARMTGFQLGTTATAGHVLTTNAAGVGTWQAAPGVTWPLRSTIDGTAAAPAYSWTADTDMGIRRGGIDNLRLVTTGTDRLTIDAAGNVGIGTTAPAHRLDVAGDINVPATGFLRIAGGAGTDGQVLTRIATGMAWATAPGAGVTWPLRSTIDGTVTEPAYSWTGDTDMGIRRGGTDNLRLVTTGADRVTIDSAGNVGIGTTAPGARLEVAGGMRLNTAVTKPACDATQRGTMWFTQGAAGVRDTLRICARNAAGAFRWMITSWVAAPTGVTVTPNPHTQNVNTSHTFSAAVSPAETDQRVTWSLINPVGLTGASISPAGVFFSGSTAGTVTVRATSVIDETIHGDSFVTVPPPVRVFVTSSMHSGNLGGLAGADSICQTRANAAGLGGIWRAWLSSSVVHARDRLTHHTVPIYLVNRTTRVAHNWADLTDGTLINAITLDEWGFSQSGWVWTGTHVDGTRWPGQMCGDWVGWWAGGWLHGGFGCAHLANAHWTTCGGWTCDAHARLYCMEQ